MKLRIKHRAMKDVCMEILESRNVTQDSWELKILWINLLGTYWDRKPFPMGSGSRLAIEWLKIEREDWKTNWIELETGFRV